MEDRGPLVLLGGIKNFGHEHNNSNKSVSHFVSLKMFLRNIYGHLALFIETLEALYYVLYYEEFVICSSQYLKYNQDI